MLSKNSWCVFNFCKKNHSRTHSSQGSNFINDFCKGSLVKALSTDVCWYKKRQPNTISPYLP